MVMNEKAAMVTASQDLGDRAQRLLKVLIDRYIRDGQPVGSRTLARDCGLDLSPATIRNVMSDLEELGLIVSPHTSAGRIPTARGYRFFIDTLLTIKPLQGEAVVRLARQMGAEMAPQRALSTASELLSEISAMAGVVMLPRRPRLQLRQLEFLPLSGHRVLVILVLNDREVQNRIIDTSRHYSAAELQQAANYLNEQFAGRDLHQVRERIVAELQDERERVNQLMATAIEMAQKTFVSSREDEDTDYLLAGETNLMGYAEMADMERLRQLFEAFNRKRDILHLLDQSLSADGIQIFIGDESGYQPLSSCSVVTAPYTVDDQVVGVLGVIGPTRMAYDRVIPLVDVTARLLGAALNQGR